jgi:hypothetical protein
LRSSKTLAAKATLLVRVQTCDSLGEEGVQPGVDGVGMAWPEEAGAGDGVGGGAVGDLEQSGGPFTDKGLGMVMAVVEQVLPLVVGKREGTALAHGKVLHGSVAPVLLL